MKRFADASRVVEVSATDRRSSFKRKGVRGLRCSKVGLNDSASCRMKRGRKLSITNCRGGLRFSTPREFDSELIPV